MTKSGLLSVEGQSFLMAPQESSKFIPASRSTNTLVKHINNAI